MRPVLLFTFLLWRFILPASGQNPDFVSEIAYDYCPRAVALSPDSIAVCGGHLQGIQFSVRTFLMSLGENAANLEWTFGEFSEYSGFATDVIRLSDGNLLVYNPEDAALIGQDLVLNLYKLNPAGELLWQVTEELPLSSLVYQTRFRVFENEDGEIDLLLPVTTEPGIYLERWRYSLDGDFLGKVTSPIEFGPGQPDYVQEVAMLNTSGSIVIGGRKEGQADFLASIGADGSLEWETETLPPDTVSQRWYSEVVQLSEGDYLVGGYYSYSEPGNYAMIQRFDAGGNFVEEVVFDDGPAVSIIRTLVELEDGRIAIGGRWEDEDGDWVPRLWIMDSGLTTTYFSILFDYDLSGSLEYLLSTESGVLVGINDILLGTAERTDIWRLTSEVLLSTEDIEVLRYRVGPIPASDEIRVIGSVDEFRLITLDGSLLSSGKLESQTIDISGFSPGIYLLQLQGSFGFQQLRVVLE